MNMIQNCIDASGVLLMKEARKRDVTKNAFYQFVKSNQFERIAQGVYLSPDNWEDESFVLHLRCPQAVFSHDEAIVRNIRFAAPFASAFASIRSNKIEPIVTFSPFIYCRTSRVQPPLPLGEDRRET